jgi:hypothetical protein
MNQVISNKYIAPATWTRYNKSYKNNEKKG